MKVTVTVGPVQVRIVGLDVTERQVRRLLAQAGQIAASLTEPAEKAEEERAPLGFAAHVERAGEPPRESFFTDDEDSLPKH